MQDEFGAYDGLREECEDHIALRPRKALSKTRGAWHRSAWTSEQQIAFQLIRCTRYDYGDPRQRGGIESWLYGDPSALSFDNVCALLHIEDQEAVKRYIREGSNTVARDQEESPDGSLAADREREHESRDTGPERLLQGAGSVDRVEARSQQGEPMADKLAVEAGEGGREGLGGKAYYATMFDFDLGCDLTQVL